MHPRSNPFIAVATLAIGLGLLGATPSRAVMFSSSEREAVLDYWEDPSRYQVSMPGDASRSGRWQVRLTPEGSKWLWDFNKARGVSKVVPTADPTTGGSPNWSAWINARIAYDRYIAACDARAANENHFKKPFPQPELVSGPGPMPTDLAALLPEPSSFAEAAEPKLHLITFHDGKVHRFVDNPNMRPNYAFYRFREGVMDGGTSMRRLPQSQLDDLLKAAGIEGTKKNVFTAVSLLEGGLDSVNTYDTGFVSVGFIQFASLSGGAGSLGQVLLNQKTQNPESFRRDFQRYGLDVNREGRLVALDLADGTERVGPDAARQIIRDKRLIAVFQRAGRFSKENQVSQLQVADRMYYPADETVVITAGGRFQTFRVRDFVKSEAGLATLMDRKVNTGGLGPIGDVARAIMEANNLTSAEQLAQYERILISRLVYREDYLKHPTLSQPPAPPTG